MTRTYAPPVYKAIEGQIAFETEKAIQFKVINKETGQVIKTEWFPKSQLATVHRSYDEIEGTFDIMLATEWILGQKGLLSVAVDKKDLIIPVVKSASSPAATTGAKSPGRIAYEKLKASRLPYKDDEDPVENSSVEEVSDTSDEPEPPTDWDDYYRQMEQGE
jgi:hypothetical protein